MRSGVLRVACAFCLLGGVATVDVAQASTGDLTQKAGTAGCVSDTGAGPCVDGVGIGDPNTVTVSPDGKNAYVASNASDAVAVFDRAADGTLAQKAGAAGCISDTGAGPCVDGVALNGAATVAISPDGKSAYVASLDSNAVSVFDRSVDGTLTQKAGTAGCISDTGAGPCVDGVALSAARSVTVSPDGKSVYVLGFASKSVAVFNRAADGTLTQKAGTAGCISETGAGPCADGTAISNPNSVTVSPDGTSAYIASTASGAVSVFDRAMDGTLTQKAGTAGCISDSGAGPCIDGVGLGGADSVSVSPDGKSAYVASLISDAVAVFDRAADGGLTQKAGTAGCISDTGTGPCADGTALVAPTSVTVSPDGNSAYVTASGSDSVAVLDRAADGSLTQKPGTAGCTSETGAGPCVDGTALDYANSVTVSPDGRNAYVSSLISDSVAIFDREPAPLPPPDTTKPLLSALKMAPHRFRAVGSGPSIAAHLGSKVSYKLSEPAKVSFKVERALEGRRVGGKCVKRRHSNRHAKPCTRYVTLRGGFAQNGNAGLNKFRFSGRLKARKLRPGRYRLRAVATDSAMNRSLTKHRPFRILRRRPSRLELPTHRP